MKCKSAMWHLQRIKSIRPILTKESCETLIVVLVLSQLDYANCLFIGLPECDLQKLQRVQNIAAKIVLKSEENSLTCLKKTAFVANITKNKIQSSDYPLQKPSWSISPLHQSNGRVSYSRKKWSTF